MRVQELGNIKSLYFTPKDVSKHLGISDASARVACSRYAKSGAIVRLKRNFYIMPQIWERLADDEAYELANLIQVPSYISLQTALSYYGISTQVQREFYESVALKRTKEVAIGDRTFVFTKIEKKLYGHFKKTRGFFIATPEKAYLDALYLVGLKRYSLDMSAIDMSKLDKKRISELLKLYPEKTNKLARSYV